MVPNSGYFVYIEGGSAYTPSNLGSHANPNWISTHLVGNISFHPNSLELRTLNRKILHIKIYGRHGEA